LESLSEKLKVKGYTNCYVTSLSFVKDLYTELSEDEKKNLDLK